MKISPARAAAFDILLRVDTTDAYASELLHSSRTAALSPADHGLATEIVMGVLRWRSALDDQIAAHIPQPLTKLDAEVMTALRIGTYQLLFLDRALDDQIAAHISQPLTKLDAEVITALRIGTYQLLFLDRIPAHAAINDSVELVKKARKRSAAGMTNAVLRKIKPATELASPVAAHPAWLANKWTQVYGSEASQQICAYDQQHPRTVIRVNDPALAEELAQEGIELGPGRILSSARIVLRGDVTRSKAFRERRLVIQDEGSQLVALLLGRGQRILDCCAAPGGKTRIIAEQNPHARVLAVELHPHRASLLKRLVPLPNVDVVAADARSMPFAGTFDRILVDAPCTGTGTLARNPEIKWRLKPEDIERLQTYQLEILQAAMRQLSPGGQLLYSTCSLQPEENEANASCDIQYPFA